MQYTSIELFLNRHFIAVRHAFSWLLITLALMAFAPSGPAVADTIAKPVKVIEISQDSAESQRVFFGRVTAKQTVDLAFQVGGQIIEFPAVEGDFIESGDLIARLDPVPFELAVDRAKVTKAQADRAFARLAQLQGSTVSQATVDDTESEAEIADIALRDAEFAMDRSVLKAPFDALVASRTVANFMTINAGTTVVRLHDMSELHVEVNVPEVLFQEVGENPNVELEVEFPASNERYPLTFREVNAEASQIGQTFRVTLGLPPQPGLLLLPGSSATVHAKFPELTAGFIVPASAIRTNNEGATFVMRLDPGDDGTEVLAEVPVELQINSRGAIEIIDGLSGGEVIVATGVQSLQDGQSVSRFAAFE